MKIGILGCTGMLGRYVYSYLSEKKDFSVFGIGRDRYDVIKDTIGKLKFILLDEKKDNLTIINCIGIIPQTNNDRTGDYIKVNSIFPNMLSVLCSDNGIQLIHITTDCVYSGKKGEYNERDFHDETNIYGLTKSLGEPSGCTVIRTSIIGEEITKKHSLLEWVRSNRGKQINGYKNHIWNGITCLELSKLIEKIIRNNLYWCGPKHFFSPIAVSKYDLILLINKVYDLNIVVNPTTNGQIVDKSLSSIYSPLFDIPMIEQQIEEQKQFSLN